MNQREFLLALSASAASVAAAGTGEKTGRAMPAPTAGKGARTTVSLVKSRDRETAIRRALDLLNTNPVQGKDVLLKPNFNSADPFPGSTHNDTLAHLIRTLQGMGATSITVGERCGPGDTRDVMEEKGIFEQEQIARAVEIGLGVSRPEDIEIRTDDAAGREYAGRVTGILTQG